MWNKAIQKSESKKKWFGFVLVSAVVHRSVRQGGRAMLQPTFTLSTYVWEFL